MADRTMVQGDLEPPLRATFTVDMSAASGIWAILKLIDGPEDIEVSGSCFVGVDPKTVEMRPWQPGETDVPGLYLVQFEVDWGSGRIETIPARPRRLVIVPSLVEHGS